MNKILLSSILIISLLICGVVFVKTASSRSLEDFGIGPEAAKYLSPEEIENILNSKTPAETMAEEKVRIEKYGTAEQKADINSEPKPAGINLPVGAVDCFEYYHFGSVQTNITADNFYVYAGEDMHFSGTITNKNDYPIVSGTLYVKIFRERGTTKDSNGPDVIDQFIAADNIIIPAGATMPVSFSWKVPQSSKSGNHRLASFFTVAKKFNLLGLSFTDDVIGNAFNFQISGEKSNIQFDKTSVAISGRSYYFAASPPRIPSEDPAVISAKVDNSTNSDQTVGIIWKLYKWDSIDPDNLIRTISEKATIKAKSSERIQITIPEADEPVYYLVGELTYKDSKSIIGIRFVRPEVDKTRLNFPSILSFPIKKNAASVIFACVHNAGTSQSVPNGKLKLKISDNSGAIIDEYTYQGPITGEMMAVKKDFISKKNLDHFFLSAQLWQSGELVDQANLEYDCSKIDPGLCSPKSNLIIILAIGIIVLLIIIGGIVVVFVKTKKKI